MGLVMEVSCVPSLVRTEDGHLRQTRFGLLWIFVFVFILNLQRKAEESSLVKVKVKVTAYYRPLRPLRENRGTVEPLITDTLINGHLQ